MGYHQARLHRILDGISLHNQTKLRLVHKFNTVMYRIHLELKAKFPEYNHALQGLEDKKEADTHQPHFITKFLSSASGFLGGSVSKEIEQKNYVVRRMKDLNTEVIVQEIEECNRELNVYYDL